MRNIIVLLPFLAFQTNNLLAQASNKTDSTQNIAKWICHGNVTYPTEAEEKNISGTVILAFDIDSACQVVNIRIEKGIGFGCDEEAMRAFKDVQKHCTGIRPKDCTPKFNLKIPFTFLGHED